MKVHRLIKVLAASLLVLLFAAAFLPSPSVAGESSITPPFPTDTIPSAEGQSSNPWNDPLLGVGLGALVLIY
jgi:hypothetical protein